MKKGRFLAGLGVVLLTTVALAACGGKKDEGKKDGGGDKAASSKTFTTVFATDPNTFDYLYTSRDFNNNHTTNFIDGLMEYDRYGNLQPALAEDWEVSKDGLTYTYHLRKDVPWVDSQGNEVAKVTANDFVVGLKHAADKKSEILYVVGDSIKGLNDYADGKISDFSQVGVKALDENTVQYTLNQPETYWNSKTTYGILYPVNEDFLKEKGDEFGAPTPDSILYNGPFILTNFTSKSVIEYTKNDSYWDKDKVKIDDVKYTFSDGSDPDSYYKGFDDGIFSSATLYPNNPAFKEVEKKYKDNIVWSLPSRSTFMFSFNFSRFAYQYTSKTTDEQKQSTQKAIRNIDFRKAIQFAFDKKTYQAQAVGPEGAEKALRNTLVPGDFVTVKGKPFYQATQEHLQKLDPEAFGDVDLKDGQNAYYNVDKAKTYMEKAKEALKKENVQFPIHLDIPQLETDEVLVNTIKSFKKMIEDAFGSDTVTVDIQLLTKDEYTALAQTSQENDFDIFTGSGWGADFTDPKTYLNVFDSQNGDLVHIIGLESKGYYKDGVDPSKEAKDAIKLAEYDKLLNAANSITDDLDKRYDAYAKAEAWLLDNVLQMPVKASGATPSITKVVPFTKPYGLGGSNTNNFKGMELSDKAITTAENEKAQKDWEAKKIEEGKKAADLVNKKIAEAK